MSRSQRRSEKRPSILIFGESSNDTGALQHLLKRAAPEIEERFTLKPMRTPISLSRDANPSTQGKWMRDLRDVVTATQRKGDAVHAIVVHRDSDRYDDSASGELQDQLAEHFSKVIPVAAVAVQELEAWFLLFPSAFPRVHSTAWRDVTWVSSDTSRINNAKQELMARTSRLSAGNRPKRYAEADSTSIAEAIAHHQVPQVGENFSWDRFVGSASAL